MEELRGLSCLVCYNAFTSTHDQSIPRNLSCGHTFCTACLERLAQQCHGLYVQCPACKCQTLLQHTTPANGIKSLPKNFGVLEIIGCKEGNRPEATQKPVSTEMQKDKTRHKCEEHDEAKKVYCYTDECLICIYCQIYGEHQGHKCELASDLAKSSRTELENMALKLQNEITRIKEAKTNLAATKTSIVNRQQLLKEQIKKYILLLQHYLSRRETELLSTINEMSACKLQALETQEKTLYEFSTRSEELCLLITAVQHDSDSGVIEEKPTLERLVDGMLCVSQACQVQPQAHNNLMFHCQSDVLKMLDNFIGSIVDSESKDEEQTDSSDNNKEHALDSFLENLEKEACLNERHDEGEQPGSHPGSESSESDDDDEGWVSVDSSSEEEQEEDEEHDEDESHAEADDEPTSEGELVGAVGGDTLPEAQQDERPKHEKDTNKQQGLLRELQHEIERLRLLGPRGDVIRVIDDTSSSAESDNDTGDAETPSLQLDLQITVNNDLGSRSKSRATTSSAMQGLVAANNRLSCDRQRKKHSPVRKHCSVNCQYHLAPTLQCKNCSRVFCRSCAASSLNCSKSESGHDFVKYGQHRNKNIKTKHSATKQHIGRRELQWECKRCTMINESHVLVCGACETSKDFDPNEVRNVCPMCTLVNELGKTNCELCDTDLEEFM